MTREYRTGVLPALYALWAPVHVALKIGLVVASLTLAASIDPTKLGVAILLITFGAPGVALVNAILAGLSLWRIGRTSQGTKGRTRLAFLAAVGLVSSVALAALTAIVLATPIVAVLSSLSLDTLKDLTLETQAWERALYYTEGALFVLSTVFVLGADVACWWLIPDKVRRVIWLVVDVVATVGFVVCVTVFPLQPPHAHPDELAGPVVRLGFTVLFVLRATSRLLPPTLDALESSSYRWLLAARLLRGRKSGFLAAIAVLSILAVTVSSCALSTVLSVMGGFRADLKRKILGNNAHIVVDRVHGDLEGWVPLVDRAHAVPGVTGASPYVGGEVMVSSVANQSGAVLRGIEPRSIGQVTDLVRNMRAGRLSYLEHPERLLDLPAQDLRCATLPLEFEGEPPPEDDSPPGSSFLRNVDVVVRDAGAPPATGPPPAAPHARPGGLDGFLIQEHEPFQHVRHVLPGIVVGQELARSLRLCLGDEVTVVTPFGGVGPTGPIPKTRSFRVAGIFYSGMYEFDMKYVYVMLPVAQQFLGTGDAISGVEIKVNEVERAPEIAALVRAAIRRPDLRVRDWQELNRNLFGALALEKLAMFITLGIAILVAGFCVFGTLLLMVQEKRREVGVLQAMGIPPSRIVDVFLLEGVLIGLLGAAIGLGAGYVSCFWIEHFGIKMNPEVYYIDRLPVSIDLVEFSVVALVSVAVCVLATIPPARVASRLRPVDALRGD